jgi:hypothetical protein
MRTQVRRTLKPNLWGGAAGLYESENSQAGGDCGILLMVKRALSLTEKAPPKKEVERGKTLLMDLSQPRTCLPHRKLSKVTGSDG